MELKWGGFLFDGILMIYRFGISNNGMIAFF